MRAYGWWWAAMLLVTWAAAAPSSEEDKTGSSLQESIKEADSIVKSGEGDDDAAASIHHRVARQLFDGFRFDSTLKDGISALENVDDMLRTTIPTIDRFQCIERLMCSVMSTDPSSSGSSITSLLQQAFDPTFQQGVIQDSTAVQQEFLQNPAIQGIQQDFLQNPTIQGILSQNPSFQLGDPQNPAFQQGLPPQNPAFQQGFQQDPSLQNPAFLPPPSQFQPPGFNPQFQPPPEFNPQFQPPPEFNPQFQPPPGFNPQFQPPPGQFAQGGFQNFQPFQEGTQFQNSFANFRENPDTLNTNRRHNGAPRPLRRRRPSRRPQRNGFLDFLGRLGLGRRKKRSLLDNMSSRKKRSLLDNIFGGFTADKFMPLVDQMLSQYSFYPYTHAAFMGYSGSSRRCETLYPSCPSTAEEMIDVFNNMHQHYPNGFPYKENLPWPLNQLLP